MKENAQRVAQGRSARLLHMAVAICVAALAIAVFRWPLVDLLTVFFEPLLEGFIWLCLLLLAIICLIRALLRRKQKPLAEYKALGSTIATILILYFVPFTALSMKVNFFMYRRSREKLVTCLLSKSCGSLVSSGGRGDLVALPSSSGYLSSGGGEVVIDHRNGTDFILFFTFRGILDRFSGYVYSPADVPPAKDEFLGDGIEIQKVASHWYWYAS